MALAVLIGWLSARRITVPLARVAQATQQIARGSRGVMIGEKTRVRELDGIAASVNDLARSLDEQEGLRRRLTADMAHELRTPLAAVQSHLEAMIDGVWQPDASRLGGLHQEILRVNRLVSDLERLARFEDGPALIARKTVDLCALLQGIVRNHEPWFREKGVTLRFASEGETHPVSLDPDRLSQAVINLLSNALKYTPAGGTVEVKARVDPEGVEIRVLDTGIGIEPADLPRIFERLYRVDDSRSRSTGGAGIGLSITRAIVEAHGGVVRAVSQPGRGSEFIIRLPLDTAPRTG
jgi:signal transduction histidine kinase